MGYWQDIFETYKSVHDTEASSEVDDSTQKTTSKKTPYMVVQIAFPLDDNTQINDFDSIQKLLDTFLKNGFPSEPKPDTDKKDS